MPDLNPNLKKNDESELGRAKELLRGWLRLPELVAFLLVAAFFLVWAFLAMTGANAAEAYVIAFLISGTAIGAGIFAIVRQVRRTRALIQRINDIESEQARLAQLAEVNISRLETHDTPELEASLAERDAHRQKRS